MRQHNGFAVASLVCSAAGIVPFFFGLPCLLGIIFGFIALGQIKRTGGIQQGRGLAIAGVIIGFSLIALFIIGIVALGVAHNNFCNANPGAAGCNGN